MLAFKVYFGENKIEIFKTLLETINENDDFLLPYLDFFLWTYRENVQLHHEYYNFAVKELKMPEIAAQLDHKINEQETIAAGSISAKLAIMGKNAYPDLINFAMNSVIPVTLKNHIFQLLSVSSNQHFTSIEDLKIWQENGFPC